MEIQWGSCKFREGLQFITQVHELDLIPLPRTEDILRILWLIALWLLSQSLTPSIHAPCTLLVFFFLFLPTFRARRKGRADDYRKRGTQGTGNIRLLLKLLPEWDSLWSSGQLLSSFFSCLLCHLTRQRWSNAAEREGWTWSERKGKWGWAGKRKFQLCCKVWPCVEKNCCRFLFASHSLTRRLFSLFFTIFPCFNFNPVMPGKPCISL